MAEIAVFFWLVMSLVSTYAAWKYWQLMEQAGRPSTPSKAVVIVPIKGWSVRSAQFIQSLLTQDHPHYRVIFAIESRVDPAAGPLGEVVGGHANVALIEAGESVACSQKVWNLAQALEHLQPDDAFIVMADADVILPPTWLSTLNWAVVDQGQDIVTGYRVIVPDSPTLSAHLVASINLSVALAPRITGLTAAWGGTMAMTRATLEKLDLAKHWARALSDDLQLTVAAREKGILVHTNRRMLLVTPWRGGFADLMEFGVRQFRILRLGDPLLHFGMIAFLAVPLAGFAVIMVRLLEGSASAFGATAILLGLAVARQFYRGRVVATAQGGVWNKNAISWQRDLLFRPLWWPLFFAMAILGSFGNAITWAGIRYRCKGPKVIAIERP